MINNLPVKPDYIYLGVPGMVPVTEFRLSFHSTTKGDLVIEDISNALQDTGVHFGSFPILEDPHNLLLTKALGLVGLSPT